MVVRKENQDDFSDFSAGIAMDGEDRAAQEPKAEMRIKIGSVKQLLLSRKVTGVLLMYHLCPKDQ
ncbi:MAG: hypothetical protein HRU25_16800 [Psychrobium sp.]|nr:hypothetical protein [Psychrobium sp.]